jgi:hypothetical protein
VGVVVGVFHSSELRLWVGVTASSSSHCKLSTKWEEDGVLVPSLMVSSASVGMMQASGSERGVEGGELSWGSSMKFAMR